MQRKKNFRALEIDLNKLIDLYTIVSNYKKIISFNYN